MGAPGDGITRIPGLVEQIPDCSPNLSQNELDNVAMPKRPDDPHRFPPVLLLILLFALLSPACSTPPSGSNNAKQRPNVLLILTDDQGWGDVAASGADDLKTPHMDQLIQNGMRFDNFYANSPVCSPTRAALLTGRYPDHVGVPGVIRSNPDHNWGYLDPDATLIAEPLNRAGYHTAIIGKWHLGLTAPNRPNDHGFDFFHGFLGDMMDDYWTHRRNGTNYMRRNTTRINPDGHATDLFSEWSARYIRRQADSDRPWFLYLPYNAPHFPVQPPEKWVIRVKKREDDIDPKRAELVAFIEHLDHGIGRVLDALKSSGQRTETLILFTSDNGGHKGSRADNGPHRGYKQDLYEGGLAVPMAAVWPGRIDAGTRSDLVATTMDLYPTLLDAADAEGPRDLDGTSILPTLLGRTQSINRPLFFVRREGGSTYQGRAYYAVRQGKWKLLQNHPFERYKLYNLQEDPMEQNNVADQFPGVVRSLSGKLRKHIQDAGEVPWQKPAGE